jgi:hypothetical protein
MYIQWNSIYTFKKEVRYSGSHLQSQLLGEQRLGGLWFQTILGKKVSETSSQQFGYYGAHL